VQVEHGLTQSAGSPNNTKNAQHETHSDTEVSAKGLCTEPVRGSKLKITLLKEFSKIKTLNLQIITDDAQSSKKLTKPIEEVDL
jgi:hypothetical protein